jgi:alkaline phosphatase
MDFAKKNGETTVIVLPDHGNSGFTIGRRDLKSYDKASLNQLFANVSKYKKTGEGLERILLKSKPEDFKRIFKEYTDIDLSEEELNLLLGSGNYKETDYMKAGNSVNMTSSIIRIMNQHTYFGFTTGGHTGEEVFLAAYHPNGDLPVGMNTNTEINQYLFDAMGLKTSLPEMTNEIFAKHTDVFKGLDYTIDKSADFPVLKVKKGNMTLTIPAFKSVVYLNSQPVSLNSVTVYIDRNDTFYIPKSLANKL